MKKFLFFTIATIIVNNTQVYPDQKPQHVYAVFANDNTQGLSHAAFEQAVSTLNKKGHKVDEMKLYDHHKDIPFFQHGKDIMENNAFYMDNQKRFLEADTLLIVFPMYWYSMPAIMKAWIDMINAWAYKFEKDGSIKPLHSVKKAVIIYTSMLDRNSLSEQVNHAVEAQMLQTCKFLSINDVTIHHIGNVYGQSKEELTKHIENITQKL